VVKDRLHHIFADILAGARTLLADLEFKVGNRTLLFRIINAGPTRIPRFFNLRAHKPLLGFVNFVYFHGTAIL
jgi:hypothetical protein